ncbi:MAG: hypothetical protein CM15mP128_3480 [Methanobacteriota archaeon]|nr:MAG: hypothetical protein CM15mP128_3480 [Euryarchaeota archaeon]
MGRWGVHADAPCPERHEEGGGARFPGRGAGSTRALGVDDLTTPKPARKQSHRPGPGGALFVARFRGHEDVSTRHTGDWDVYQKHVAVNVLHGPTADEEPDGGADPASGRPDADCASGNQPFERREPTREGGR